MAEDRKTSSCAGAALEADQFAALLQKEFKPKTDRARAEVENAVRTLAEQALRETTVVSDDVIGTIKAIIAEIDKKLTDQVNLILHNERLPAGGKRLARPALSRQQHRNRRDAEDPRHEHLEEGPRARR